MYINIYISYLKQLFIKLSRIESTKIKKTKYNFFCFVRKLDSKARTVLSRFK